MTIGIQTILIVFVAAILIQFCVDRIKEVVGEKVMSYVKAPAWALILGIAFAFIFDMDVFAMLGYSAEVPIIPKVISGLILSAGAEPLHELISKIRETRIELTQKEE